MNKFDAFCVRGERSPRIRVTWPPPTDVVVSTSTTMPFQLGRYERFRFITSRPKRRRRELPERALALRHRLHQMAFRRRFLRPMQDYMDRVLVKHNMR